MKRRKKLLAVLLVVPSLGLLALGCSSMRKTETTTAPGASVSASKIRPAPEKLKDTDEAVEESMATLKRNAKEQRAQWQGKTFEDFERSVYKESGERGKYIVNGDTPIADRKHLREFFEENIKKEPPQTQPGHLAVMMAGGQQAVWNTTQKKQLTYCVSPAFGARQQAVVDAVQGATGAWSAVADVAFTHVASEDAHCAPSSTNVVFDVRPVNVNGQYLARAFFPNEPRADRNVLIDESSFHLDPNGKLQLVGILRHELGHSLGWRHEHTRPESGTCFEDTNWKPITAYDRFSVMHYPQCNGGGDWSLTLTSLDKDGAACVYGAAPGFAPNTASCLTPAPPPPPTCVRRTRTYHCQRVAADQDKNYRVFSVSPGSRFDVKMTGAGPSPGDPDVYVRFGARPDRAAGSYACRPYLVGANETCSLDAPQGMTKAYVMVHGYEAGSYDLVATSCSHP